MLCYDCPRKCGVERNETKGFCGEGDKIRVAKIIENFIWEEPCISGKKGALAIFFAGCNLRCEFCQNYKISHNGYGEEYSPSEFKNFLKSYDLSKFSCVDLVTPTHFSSLLLQALSGEEWQVPIVWNSSGYENEEMIEKLAKVVDVFLPDFKYFSGELSKKFSKADDYFEVTLRAIKKMREIKKENIYKNDILTSGLLIRHLVLPQNHKDSMRVLKEIKDNIKKPVISIMSQFTPNGNGGLKRKLYPLEYKSVLAYAQKLGLNEGYLQDLTSSSEDFVPDF